MFILKKLFSELIKAECEKQFMTLNNLTETRNELKEVFDDLKDELEKIDVELVSEISSSSGIATTVQWTSILLVISVVF